MTDFERLRLGMVDCQIRVVDVTDPRILAAFLETPRERFVPEGQAALAYLDMRVPLGVAGRAAFDPINLSRLVQLAAPKAGERALVVGCGLGYTVALFAALGLETIGLETDPTLAAGARERLAGTPGASIVEGPLAAGAPADAPFDLIFCDGSVVEGLERLGEQLSAEGRLVAAAGPDRATKATVFSRQGDGLASAPFFDANGPLLPGFERVEAFAF